MLTGAVLLAGKAADENGRPDGLGGLSGLADVYVRDAPHNRKLVEIFICDTHNHAAKRFILDQESGIIVSKETILAGFGRGAGRLCYPCGVWAEADTVYIADTSNHRIVACPLEASTGARTGTVVAGGLGRGNELQQLQYPHRIAIAPSWPEALIIADTGNNRILRWPLGSRAGVVLVSQQCQAPTGLAVLPEGTVVTTQPGVPGLSTGRIKVWPPNQGGGQPVVLPSLLSSPNGVCFFPVTRSLYCALETGSLLCLSVSQLSHGTVQLGTTAPALQLAPGLRGVCVHHDHLYIVGDHQLLRATISVRRHLVAWVSVWHRKGLVAHALAQLVADYYHRRVHD